MKRLFLIALLALAPAAFGASSVLTAKGLLYSLEKPDDEASILLMRRSADAKAIIVVPSTVDSVRDYRPQLEYDRAHDRLFVIWIRESETSCDVMMSRLESNGDWSDALVVSTTPAPAHHDELRTALTRSTGSDGSRATLIHIASWVRDGEVLRGEYSLVAFDSESHFSTSNANFQNIDDVGSSNTIADDLEVINTFPALAMAPISDGVDVVFGSEKGTALTRTHITPRLDPNARLWKPVGRTGGSMPPAHFAATSIVPVRTFFVRDRVVLYTNDKTFRFVVFEGGEWSTTQEFTLDESLTGDALLTQIRRMIEDELPSDPVTMSK
jgi:hypothetical protein